MNTCLVQMSHKELNYLDSDFAGLQTELKLQTAWSEISFKTLMSKFQTAWSWSFG